VDLANDESVRKAIEKTKEKFGRIDVAVNNAGYGIGGSIEELNDKEVRESFDINVFGTINVIRHVLPVMRAQGSGHIINISSIAGIAPGLGWSVYGAAKHAVIGLTEVLAEDVKPFGIKATVVAPGGFRTNFNNPDSVVFAGKQLEAYAGIRATHGRFSENSGHQKGDPDKAARAMIELAENAEPPVYLLLGTDAYERALKKIELLNNEFTKAEITTKSTDY
ncbi:MAG: SDR family NAD(P)-dependent oxidoreductase, partial [Flavitalea sp.]